MRTLAEAIELYQAERYLDAARRLKLVVEFHHDNAEAWMYYGSALSKLGQWDEAATALGKVVTLRPEQVSAWCDLAEALLAAGRDEDAVLALDAAAELAPNYHAIGRLRGRLAAQQAPEPPAADVAPSVDSPPAAPAPVRRSRQPRLPRLHLEPERRLPLMLAVLALLLVVMAVRSALAPGEKWRLVREADERLTQVERKQHELRSMPGEDFDAGGDLQALTDRAEALAMRLNKQWPRLPEGHWLAARCALARRQYADAERECRAVLALLGEQAAGTAAGSGVTVGELRARAWRLQARALFGTDRGAATRAQAHECLRQAQQVSQDPLDADLARQLDAP